LIYEEFYSGRKFQRKSFSSDRKNGINRLRIATEEMKESMRGGATAEINYALPIIQTINKE
jgi:hypothetical protein